MNRCLRWNKAMAEHFFNSDMGGDLLLARGRVLLGRGGLMRVPRRQRSPRVCSLRPLPPEVASNLRKSERPWTLLGVGRGHTALTPPSSRWFLC